jgi:hypothetical protein
MARPVCSAGKSSSFVCQDSGGLPGVLLFSTDGGTKFTKIYVLLKDTEQIIHKHSVLYHLICGKISKIGLVSVAENKHN